ncbi:hypothetical protein QA640_08985 [Bradyrhizobium sp. CB82]|uniref:hypothetical protein n=1 Tax=Bradyrhizobium sp. CB82 TaxID=3039159 RepID=UPI0024B0C441|nr:hypothetical protein [Bradyrhizobium sp. CB82]WFU42579.1 hypothetical protein QA640_08985 [Bradyrhizobium sp. CB82]
MNFYLETVNGTIVILLATALAFLSLYIVQQKQALKLAWWKCLTDPPPGIALALPMAAIKAGLVLTRGTLWAWREFGGEQMTGWQLDLVLTGTAVTALGALSLVRVLSRARFGDWPWIISAMLVVIYITEKSIEQCLA